MSTSQPSDRPRQSSENPVPRRVGDRSERVRYVIIIGSLFLGPVFFLVFFDLEGGGPAYCGALSFGIGIGIVVGLLLSSLIAKVVDLCYYHRDREVFTAVENDDLHVLEMLFREGQTANLVRIDDEKTPLHFVQSREVTELLLEHDASLDLCSKNATPFTLAVLFNRFDVALCLSENGANVDGKPGLSALHNCTNRNQVDFLNQLGANLEERNAEQWSGREPSIFFDEKTMARFLVATRGSSDGRSGSDPGKTEHDSLRERFDVDENFVRVGGSETPLHSAVRTKNDELVEALLDCGSIVNATDAVGNTPLHFATTETITKLLLMRGADVNAKACGDITPLHIALLAHRVSIAEVLLQYGANTQDPLKLISNVRSGAFVTLAARGGPSVHVAYDPTKLLDTLEIKMTDVEIQQAEWDLNPQLIVSDQLFYLTALNIFRFAYEAFPTIPEQKAESCRKQIRALIVATETDRS